MHVRLIQLNDSTRTRGSRVRWRDIFHRTSVSCARHNSAGFHEIHSFAGGVQYNYVVK